MDDNSNINLIDHKLQRFTASYPGLEFIYKIKNHIKCEQNLTDNGIRWLRNHLSKGDFDEVMHILQDAP